MTNRCSLYSFCPIWKIRRILFWEQKGLPFCSTKAVRSIQMSGFSESQLFLQGIQKQVRSIFKWFPQIFRQSLLYWIARTVFTFINIVFMIVFLFHTTHPISSTILPYTVPLNSSLENNFLIFDFQDTLFPFPIHHIILYGFYIIRSVKLI